MPAGRRRDHSHPGQRPCPSRGSLVMFSSGGPGWHGRGKQRIPYVSVRLPLVWPAWVRGVGHSWGGPSNASETGKGGSAGGRTRRRTEWRPRHAIWQFGSNKRVAIGELTYVERSGGCGPLSGLTLRKKLVKKVL